MTQRSQLPTPAKINLFLRITGRRSDGYHELDSLFLPVALFDRITLKVDDAPQSSVALRCNWREIPLDDANLAVRAARLFLEARGLRRRVAIDLHKAIPAGAGLGGGSADAGAVLRLMARMAAIEPPALAAIALRLGADVPFFLDPRPARVAGVGARITYLERKCRLHLVIGVPPFPVSTAEIYRHLERHEWSGPGPVELPHSLEPDQISQALLVNDLESVAIRRYPQIGEIKALLQNLGAAGALMSGSGGAVFAIFAGAAAAQLAAQSAALRMPQVRFIATRIASRIGAPAARQA
jgi:4-diphosphocytidyl-2-C-methyl-D-erythritol kinase